MSNLLKLKIHKAKNGTWTATFYRSGRVTFSAHGYNTRYSARRSAKGLIYAINYLTAKEVTRLLS
jgi:uncharacterized protein YegP (UPF0339 family)